ncbi:hypothetical protein AXW37_03350 [Yersinia ruckeri]|nr:hypothetical protein UGYR_06870 [Yersinia ruckeri]AUQ42126.1 hypothetical protein NJ56_09520 [Yersinia ruckeri]OIX31387.1 hypothetical protein AXW18_03340 [Yersinia ruckeri]OIX31820.1 hypothetical protein AXW19_03335 [Yersinia ruckeri]OIX32143.1 hypothetical protein AXW20_03335 [Yersinia ruckeri]
MRIFIDNIAGREAVIQKTKTGAFRLRFGVNNNVVAVVKASGSSICRQYILTSSGFLNSAVGVFSAD